MVLGNNSGLGLGGALHIQKDYVRGRLEQSVSSNGSFYYDLIRNRESPSFKAPNFNER